MTVLAPAALDNPTKSKLRVGLLASALPMPDVRWHGGISYRPIDSNVPHPSNSTFYPCTTGYDINLETGGVVSWEPFGIAVGDTCQSVSTDEDEETARTTARLELQTEYLVSRTFWTGEVGPSDFATLGSPNRPLADLDSDELTTSGPVGVVTAFSRMIQYLADIMGSERGMIHVAPHLVPFLAFYGVVYREGFQTLTSIADHVVVPGAGYDGSAPDGSAAGEGTTWIYGTSMVRAAVSPISVYSYFNRTGTAELINQWETRASRLAIAEWDLQVHGAAQVCIPDPGPSCTEIPS